MLQADGHGVRPDSRSRVIASGRGCRAGGGTTVASRARATTARPSVVTLSGAPAVAL